MMRSTWKFKYKHFKVGTQEVSGEGPDGADTHPPSLALFLTHTEELTSLRYDNGWWIQLVQT